MPFWPAAAAGGAATNPNPTYETLGVGTGAGTQITSGGTNSEGSWVQLSGLGTAGVTVAALCGFVLWIGVGNSTSVRDLVDLSFDGGTNSVITDLYVQPSTNGGYARIEIPLQVPAGSNVAIRFRSTGAASTFYAWINGTIASASLPPGYTTCTTLLTADTTTTRASSTSVPLTTSATAWTQLVASTAAQYGAFLLTLGETATPPAGAVTEGVHMALAAGGSGSEVVFGHSSFVLSTANPFAPRAISTLIHHTLAASQRLTCNLQAVTVGAGPDAFFVNVHAFS